MLQHTTELWGIGQLGQYQYQDMAENEFVSSTNTFKFEFQEREHLIREGRDRQSSRSGDNMFISVRIRLEVHNGRVTKEQFEDSGVVCR